MARKLQTAMTLIDKLYDIDYVAGHPGTTLIYDEPLLRTKVYRFRDGPLDVAIKHSRYWGLRRRFRWLRRGTPAEGEFNSARLIAQAGIPTAEPLGYRCRRTLGLPSESVLVLRWIADAPSLSRQPGGWVIRQAVARLIGKVFAAGLYPIDLHLGNVLARRSADGGLEMFLIDQPMIARAPAMDSRRIAIGIGRFYLQASWPDGWGPWVALKWLAAMIGQLKLPLADRRRLWRRAIVQAGIRQATMRQRFFDRIEEEPPAPGSPMISRKEVIARPQLEVVADAWSAAHQPPNGQWQAIRSGGRDWLVLATPNSEQAKAAWLRLTVLWNLQVPAPRPAGWLVESHRDWSMVVAQPQPGEPIAAAMSQASEPVRRQLSWQLARLIVRLRRAGARIPASAAGRMIAIGQAGRLTTVGFDRDVAIEFAPPLSLDGWREQLIELGCPIDERFRQRLIADLRRAARLSRWMMV